MDVALMDIGDFCVATIERNIKHVNAQIVV